MAHNARQIKSQRHPANRKTGRRGGRKTPEALARLHSARVAHRSAGLRCRVPGVVSGPIRGYAPPRTHGCWCSSWKLMADDSWRIWRKGRWLRPKSGEVRMTEREEL